MKLTDENLRFLHDSAVAAARQAGDIIRYSENSALDVKTKTAGDTLASQVVTEVDLLCEKAIISALQSSCDAFDLGLLTEEQGDDGSRLVKDYFWCVDPIDGTLSFIEGVPGFSVSIALLSKAGEALIGVVYDPVSDTLYSAIRGKGAWKNAKPWQLPPVSSLTDQALTLVCDRSLEAKPFYSELLCQFETVANDMGAAGLHTLHNGGAVMNGCWVLENTPACYFKIPKPQQGGGSLWDFAAITCLFEEMGAVVTAFNGKPLVLNPADTTFMNDQGVIFATDKRLASVIQQMKVG
ncbi:MAG: inositol monophosphatase [Gammaproteobacteria bacterium]|nr:inositol monophosphatase [Gammaproteobacteria bacterium]